MPTRAPPVDELRDWCRLSGQLGLTRLGPTFAVVEELLAKDPTCLQAVYHLSINGKDAPNVLEILTYLKAKRSDLGNVVNTHGRNLSTEQAIALMELIRDISALKSLTLCGKDDQEVLMPAALGEPRHWPNLVKLELKSVAMDIQAMKSLCDSLSAREYPISSLELDFGHLEGNALSIFIDTIPRMRLESLWCNNITQEQVYELLERLNRCDTVKELRLGGKSTISFSMNDRLVKSMGRAFDQLPILRTFFMRDVGFIPREKLTSLGQIAASRPSLEEFRTQTNEEIQGDVSIYKDFFTACGYHPRLTEVAFSSYAPDIDRLFGEHQLVSHSWRAQCFVILLAGATITRVGERSKLWGMKKDLFRKLLTFLPRDHRQFTSYSTLGD